MIRQLRSRYYFLKIIYKYEITLSILLLPGINLHTPVMLDLFVMLPDIF